MKPLTQIILKKIPSEIPKATTFNRLEAYRNFNFIPGDKLLFFDDFSNELVGDIPSKWNTYGYGKIEQINNTEGNWLELKSDYRFSYSPLLTKSLPKEFTIEFDLLASGLDHKTFSTARLNINITDNNTLNNGSYNVQASLPFGQYSAFGIGILSYINNEQFNKSIITADIRRDVLNKPHISIAVNHQRFRLWINQIKYIDIPQLLPENREKAYLNFNLVNFKDSKERLFIKNLKITEADVDLRESLLTYRKISTNGILFDTGEASIKPQSYGIIRLVSEVLKQDNKLKLVIIGHTDSDGSETTNLALSKRRADAVKQALVNLYNIESDKLTTDGRGESVPVTDNKTVDGKAQNRRVEFILR